MNRANIRPVVFSVAMAIVLWSASTDASEPVFYWNFDERAGTIAHDAVGNNDGYLNTAQWSIGQVGGAVHFDGQDDYIQLQDDSLDGLGRTFTVCAWVRRDSVAPNRQNVILGYGDRNTLSRYLYYSVSFDRLFYYARLAGDSGNDCMYRGSTDLQADRWYHVALVVDGTVALAYIDGLPETFEKATESECKDVYGFSDIAQIAQSATIGAVERNDGHILPFHGSIDELMVFNEALSTSEIMEVCERGFSLAAHWKLDEGSGDIAYDSAGDNNGEIHGAQWVGGSIGGALSFDGGQDYVEIPDNDTLDITGAITIAAWMRIDGYTSWPRIVAKGGDGDYDSPYGIMLDADGRYLIGYMGDGASWNSHLYDSEELTPGIWYHVAMSYSRSAAVFKMFLNGDEVLSVRETADIITSDVPLGVGAFRYRGNWQNFFDGSIDDVRIYNRQLNSEQILQLWQGDIVQTTYHVDVDNGGDENDGMTRDSAFETIQKAIDTSQHGDTVLVWPGIYLGPIDFKGKTITVRSAAAAATIVGLWEDAVAMQGGEGPESVLKHFVIADSRTGIMVRNGSAPTLTNLTVVNNDVGIEADSSSDPAIANCIVWANSQESLVGCSADYSWVGWQHIPDHPRSNISGEPAFADPDHGDYHLRSERGRYWPQHDVWILDDVTSPCIDAGDPDSDFSAEPIPNGGRINIGAYGGTPYASMSESPVLMGDLNRDSVVNLADLALLGMNWLATE